MFSCTTAQHIHCINNCTNCTVCNWTVLTVITQKLLLLHVQLHNSTAHSLYKYCTNSTVCNWTVLTVITQKLLLHVQLHYSTAHSLYKYCTNCTVHNWTPLTVITQKLLLHVQLFNRRETAKLISPEVQCRRLFEISHTHFQRLDPSDSGCWLQAQCRNLTVIRNNLMLQRWLTGCANWRPTQIISLSSAD
jgi:hypothetical protein